jgi:hypothetical protein
LAPSPLPRTESTSFLQASGLDGFSRPSHAGRALTRSRYRCSAAHLDERAGGVAVVTGGTPGISLAIGDGDVPLEGIRTNARSGGVSPRSLPRGFRRPLASDRYVSEEHSMSFAPDLTSPRHGHGRPQPYSRPTRINVVSGANLGFRIISEARSHSSEAWPVPPALSMRLWECLVRRAGSRVRSQQFR